MWANFRLPVWLLISCLKLLWHSLHRNNGTYPVSYTHLHLDFLPFDVYDFFQNTVLASFFQCFYCLFYIINNFSVYDFYPISYTHLN